MKFNAALPPCSASWFEVAVTLFRTYRARALVGLALNFAGVDPIKALVFTAVFNGVAAVPLLYLIARINGDAAILGAHTGGPVSQSLVGLTVGVMGLAAVGLLYTTLTPS